MGYFIGNGVDCSLRIAANKDEVLGPILVSWFNTTVDLPFGVPAPCSQY